jgi:hypothetical protein
MIFSRTFCFFRRVTNLAPWRIRITICSPSHEAESGPGLLRKGGTDRCDPSFSDLSTCCVLVFWLLVQTNTYAASVTSHHTGMKTLTLLKAADQLFIS